MPKPNCKDCAIFDAAYGLPGRCKLAMESIKHKILNNSATADELRYFIRTEELPDEYWQWACENFEQKGNRTNREALNAMNNEQFAKFMNHMDCSCCAYYADPDTEPNYVCAKQHERSNDPKAAYRICIDGLAKWLGQEEDWWMKEEQK